MPLIGKAARNAFRSKPAAVELPWYLVDGVDAANCVVAYKAKGAASLAASLVNQANPGTKDATAPVAAPTFDAATGWTFDGATQYLSAGDLSATKNFTALMRYSDFVYGAFSSYPFGAYGGGNGQNLCILFDNSEGYTTGTYFFGGFGLIPEQAASSGVVACNADGFYIDGSLAGTTAGAVVETVLHSDLLIGAANIGAAGQFSNIKIQAVVIFNRTLTAAEIAAISAKLAAL